MAAAFSESDGEIIRLGREINPILSHPPETMVLPSQQGGLKCYGQPSFKGKSHRADWAPKMCRVASCLYKQSPAPVSAKLHSPPTPAGGAHTGLRRDRKTNHPDRLQ
jgi:hypothetical protein